MLTEVFRTVVMAEVVELFTLSLMTASLSLFVWKCEERGMIFRRYYILGIYYWIHWWHKKDRWKRKYLKVFLLLCPYCFGTWINIIAFVLFSSRYELIFFSIGLNYIFIEIGLKYIKFKH